MAKKGPIGKVEGFYIQNNYKNLDLEQIASDLDRSRSSVETYIKKNKLESNPVSGIKAGDHFAKRNGSVVMTETASSLSDNNRKKRPASRNCTVKIKND